MPILRFTVPNSVAASVRARAAAEKKSVSQYLADLVVRDLDSAWPPGYFERVVGGWRGDPLKRAHQGDFEQRDR